MNTNKGFFLEFYKIPNTEEDPKKKKQPPPKNVNADDLKPLLTVGWVNLTELLIPGNIEIVQRCPIMLKETYEKYMIELENFEKNNPDVEKKDEIEFKEGTLDLFQKAKTYVYLKITITPAINPNLPKEGLPIPNDILKKEEKINKQNTAEEICADFRKQLKIAIEAVAKVSYYFRLFYSNIYCFLVIMQKINSNKKIKLM